VELTGGSLRTGNKSLDQEIGTLVQVPTPGAYLTASPEELFVKADAVIDFTTPDYTKALGELAEKHGKILVCGTTGLKEAGINALKKNAKRARIICSPNMSIGVNLLLGLVEKVAAILPAEECDIEIDEMHHRLKVDAPSGTALTLGAAAARGRKVQLADVRTDYQQSGLGARKQGAIGFSVRRGGDVIGDHTVTFACAGERVELAHKASNRDIYATGAIRAALWAKDKPAGFYSMRDVLGI
jgi:4-hydroxy-tetrahydrodipicolinate reductase